MQLFKDNKIKNMSREIKFRSWNVQEKIMHHEAMPSWNGVHEVWENNIPQSEIKYLTNGPADEGILMQYTGRKDKNGKEIYESDICDGHSDGIGVITWTEFDGGYDYVFTDEANVGIWEVRDLKVIGNIYENPELLIT